MKFTFKALVFMVIRLQLLQILHGCCCFCTEEQVDLSTEFLKDSFVRFASHSENTFISSHSNNNKYLFESRIQVERRNDTKFCRFRDWGLYPQELWVWMTSATCYSYTDPNRLYNALPLITIRYNFNNVSYRFYATTINGTILPFDYTNEEMNGIVASTFTTDTYYQKWYDCSVAAQKCCMEEMNDKNIIPSKEYPCTSVWDGWSCFPQTPAGITTKKPCPLYSVSATSFPCTLYSEKRCFPNGTWNQVTDYTGCSPASIYRRRHNFHIIVLYVSLFISLPAVVIFLSYQKLRVLRVNLHRNLLIACIVRNVLTIISKNLVILDALNPNGKQVMITNGVWCRILSFLENAAVNSIYACMVIDGFYLHKMIVRIFSDDSSALLLYTITIVSSIAPSLAWAIARAISYDEDCWMSDNKGYSWISDSFRITILAANLYILFDICRVLVVKLRRNNTSEQTKSAVKAMFFLVPLFGIPFILTIDTRIAGKSCIFGDVFYYFSYSCQALQGICVACIFCYFNKEVKTQIIGTYRLLRINLSEKYGWPKIRDSHFRRATATTIVGRPSNYKTTNNMKSMDFGSSDNNYTKSTNPEENKMEVNRKPTVVVVIGGNDDVPSTC